MKLGQKSEIGGQLLDTNQAIVSQNEFKKFIAPSTRLPGCGQALSSQRPRPRLRLLSNYILASFALFARETIFSYLLVLGKIQICLARAWRWPVLDGVTEVMCL